MRYVLLLTLLILSLVACNQDTTDEPLVRKVTPVAADASFVTYQHDTEVFTLRTPPDWIPNDLPDDNGVRVEFSTLEGSESVVRLTVHVVNTGDPVNRESFLQLSNNYLPPSDVADYEWSQLQAPVDQPDGSRRLVGVRYYPTIGARALNIFMQSNGRYFSVLEADVTDASAATLETLEAVVNTFRVNTEVVIREGEVIGGVTYTGNIGFDGYLHWSDGAGGFNITGNVVNNQDFPIEAVRLTGYLYDARGNRLSQETAILDQAVLRPGESSPFRLRFEGGRPSTAVRYELEAAARVANFSLLTFYGIENFEVVKYETEFTPNGNLVVSGQLLNIGSRLVREVQVIVSVLNDQGQVVAMEAQYINKDQLLPAEDDTYRVVIYDLGGAPSYYDLTVVGVAE